MFKPVRRLRRRLAQLADQIQRLLTLHAFGVYRKWLSGDPSACAFESGSVQSFARAGQKLLRLFDLGGVVVAVDFDKSGYRANSGTAVGSERNRAERHCGARKQE